jgi:hypothetical protein
MSNYHNEQDKLQSHLEELIKKHRALDEYIEQKFHNKNITDEVRKLKTQKLWLKDEIHRIESKLAELGPHLNGSA